MDAICYGPVPRASGMLAKDLRSTLALTCVLPSSLNGECEKVEKNKELRMCMVVVGMRKEKSNTVILRLFVTINFLF